MNRDFVLQLTHNDTSLHDRYELTRIALLHGLDLCSSFRLLHVYGGLFAQKTGRRGDVGQQSDKPRGRQLPDILVSHVWR